MIRMIFEKFDLLSLFVFIIILCIGLYLFYIGKKKNYINKKYKNNLKKNYKSKDLYFVRAILIFLSLFSLSIVLLGPKGGLTEKAIKTYGIDIVVVLDVSKSMNALDFKDSNYLYSRLSASKDMIANFMKNHNDDRFGLVVFAGEAMSISPLTQDSNIFLTFLEGVDSNNLSEQGTDLHDALAAGIDRFDSESKRSKVMLLISDGGDEGEVDNLANLKRDIKENNISLYTIGVGSLDGNYIPEAKDVFGNIVYKKYNGSKVVTKLNEKQLKYLASKLGGKYFRAQTMDDLNKINKNLAKLEKHLLESNVVGERKDLTRLFVGISFVLFILYFMVLFYEKSLFDFNLLSIIKGRKESNQ